MERTVPSATSEEIQLYRSTMYSLLRSTTEVQIRSLEEIHSAMNSLLHPGADDPAPDLSAFLYSALRLPDCMPQVCSVVLGQTVEVFRRHGFSAVETWQNVSARARRRRCYFDGKDTMACFIGSRSDIEDVIPALTAYQIEWNKMHLLFQRWPEDLPLEDVLEDAGAAARLADILKLPIEDVERMRIVWGKDFLPNLREIQSHALSIGVRLLSGSLSQYMRATHEWWENIERACPQIARRPIYFVSSNTHSLINVLLGFPLRQQEAISAYILSGQDANLTAEWQAIQAQEVRSSRENFLYYVIKKFQQTHEGRALLQAQAQDEAEHGVIRVPSEHTFDVDAQVIDLSRLDPARMDPRLQGPDFEFLTRSDAIILNIDYPLGLAAFHIVSKLAEQATEVLGIYVMGKSASLNAARGDVMIPNVVQDEHSHNTYLFDNCFRAADVSRYLRYGAVLDNQKSISVLGTFLQNIRIREVFFREGYADLEMEAGPFLSAAYEMYRPKRHPIDELVNLHGMPFDMGILHYVSDRPLNKGKNLGAGTLSYYGIDSTYATTLAIAGRIFQQEAKRLGSPHRQPVLENHR